MQMVSKQGKNFLSSLIYTDEFYMYKDDWWPSMTWTLMLYPENSFIFAQNSVRFFHHLQKENTKKQPPLIYVQ